MDISGFQEQHFEVICQQFLEEYRAPQQAWSIETVRAYVRALADESPELFLIATDEQGRYAGCLFGQSYWHYEGKFAHISSMQVNPEFRGQGLATVLMKEFTARAQKLGLVGILLQVDESKAFPKQWYERIGFSRMNWMEYCARLDEIAF